MNRDFITYYKLYIDKQLSIRQISNQIGVSPNTVRRDLVKFNIERRDKNERDDWWQNKHFLYKKYVDENLSTTDISKLVDVSPKTVSHWLSRFSIKVRPSGGSYKKGTKMSNASKKKMSEAKKGKYRGKDNPNWRGNLVSTEKRLRASYKNKLWRNSVLERDEYICQKCGAQDNLHVHHILEFSKFPEQRFNINNGITVCMSCHEDIHKRSFPNWLNGKSKIAKDNITEPSIAKTETYSISKKSLENLYKDRSTAAIGRLHGVCAETVRKKLIHYGIARRNVGGKRSKWIPKKELRQLYPKFSMRKIADMYGLSETLVWKMLHEYRLKTKD